MSRVNQLKVYYLANQFVSQKGYHVVWINEPNAEVWLEKQEGHKTHVIRLIQSDLVWRNHIQADIELVLNQMRRIQRQVFGSKWTVHNVYVSSYPFTESFDMFHQPIVRDRIELITYHLSDYDEVEQQRFWDTFGISPVLKLNFSDEQIEQMIHYYIHTLKHSFVQKRKAVQNLFTYGKPRLTYLFILMNVVIFLLLELSGGSTNIDTLIQFGAKYNLAMIEGEWWRLFTSMFLHIGFLHLLMNMFALYYLGTAVEQIFGSVRFLIIYLLAGLGGSLASFAFTVNVSAGASGAIFGLFGALLFFGLNHKQVFFQTMGKNILFMIGLNIVFGLVVPQIDHSAHLGGLVMGFLASALVSLPKKRQFLYQAGGFILYAMIFGFLWFYGLENPHNLKMVELSRIEQLIAEENYPEVVRVTTDLLAEPTDYQAQLLFQRAYAYIALNQPELAISDLEASIEIEPNLAEAYYNLAILYMELGQIDLAKERIEEAIKLRPNNREFRELYQNIRQQKLID